MNKEQQKQVIALIKKDCHLRKKYYCDGKTCVIGKLALESGIDSKYFFRKCSPDLYLEDALPKINNHVKINNLTSIISKINKKFNLGLFNLINMQDINDDEIVLKKRRKKLIAYVKGIELKEL